MFKAIFPIGGMNTDFFLSNPFPEQLFVPTNYLFCCNHKSLTAEYFPKSAAACLIGFMVKQAAFALSFIYCATFFRKEYGFSTELGALVIFARAVCVNVLR